jgi:hypothetical protein
VLHNNNIVPLYHTFSNVSLFYMWWHGLTFM